MDAGQIALLLVDADSGEPVSGDWAPPVHGESGADGEQEGSDIHSFFSQTAAAGLLEEQRWGLVLPEGKEGDRLRDLVAPLVALRREQQGGAPVVEYRVPASMSESEVSRWKKTIFYDGGVRKADIPRYLLCLGDLPQVPLALQQVMAVDSYVGRLAFSKDADYEAYVDKVQRWGQAPAPAAPPKALFYAVHDGTRATRLGYRSLVAPGIELLKEGDGGGWRADDVLDLGPRRGSASPDDLLRQVADHDPAMLFTMSHGLGRPTNGWGSQDEMLRRQGAMSFKVRGRGPELTGADLADRPFLPGGIWFIFACFGAGTPAGSAYYPWLDTLRRAGRYSGAIDWVLSSLPQAGERPFIADLPKAALANPDGPLAVIGHMDLAWSYAFQTLDTGSAISRPGYFSEVLEYILRGDRVGSAVQCFGAYVNEVNREISDLVEQEEGVRAHGGVPDIDLARRAHLWMLRQDFNAYVLLGDPAVRLRVAGAAGGGSPAPLTGHLEGVGSPAVVTDTVALPPGLSTDRLIEAMGRMLAGEDPPKGIARELGVDLGQLKRWTRIFRQAGLAPFGREDPGY